MGKLFKSRDEGEILIEERGDKEITCGQCRWRKLFVLKSHAACYMGLWSPPRNSQHEADVNPVKITSSLATMFVWPLSLINMYLNQLEKGKRNPFPSPKENLKPEHNFPFCWNSYQCFSTWSGLSVRGWPEMLVGEIWSNTSQEGCMGPAGYLGKYWGDAKTLVMYGIFPPKISPSNY